jgi:hypothetical protein
VVWALNRAATSRARELRVLIDAADRLRRAQLGQGDQRPATEHYRRAFEPLAREANRVLRDAGSRVSAALDRRIRSTLLAAVTDRGLRVDLEAGRLAAEHADPGFAVLSRGLVPAEFLRDRPKSRTAPAPAHSAPAPVTRPSPTDAESRRLGRERARAVREAARETRALETQARRAERAEQAAEKRLEAMRRDLHALELKSAALKAAAEAARNAHAARASRSPRAG